MLWVPAVSALVAHCAVRVLPLPARATAEQPLIELAPSLKLTLPVGLEPVTDAVKVTLVPVDAGLIELARMVALCGGAAPPLAVHASSSVRKEYLPFAAA